DQMKAADFDDLANDRRRRRDGDLAPAAVHLLGGEHQHAQSDAADVVDAGKIDDDGPVLALILRQRLPQRRLESLGVREIDPAGGLGHDHVGKTAGGQFRGRAPFRSLWVWTPTLAAAALRWPPWGVQASLWVALWAVSRAC